MVKRLLSLPVPTADAADALACAITHAHGSRLGAHSTAGYRMKGGRLV
jgi:crossover junction endodeoxyribonuclease RuvC